MGLGGSHGLALQVASLRDTDICSGKSEKITRLQFVKSELLPRTVKLHSFDTTGW